MKRTPHLFSAASAVAQQLAGFPWSGTTLGHPDGWDAALKTLVPVMLASNQPMFVAWGADRTLLYNDAYAGILGDKHPAALGRDFLEVWHELRDSLAPIVQAAYRGEPVQMDDIELWVERRGLREETHFSFFYSPLRDESAQVAGFFCACNDTTAHILAERRLAESEARHRGVLENMEEGFTLFDRDFTILEVNDTALRLVGLPREELVGRNHWERFPGTFDSALGSMYRQALAEGRPRSLEHLYRFPDGRERWFDVRAFPVGDGLAVLFQDFTDRHNLQEELSASLERVQLALDAGAIVGTWVWDIARDRVIADDRFAASFGLDPQALKVGTSIENAFAAIHPEDRDSVREAVARSVRERGSYRCQYRVLREGAYRWVEARGRVELDAQGQPTRFPGVLLDVEERRRIEQERDRASALLQTFIEAVPGMVYAKDRDGRYLVANRGAAQVLGRSSGDIVGRTDAELLGDRAQAAEIAARDAGVLASGSATQAEERLTRGDGTPAIWWSTKEPLRDAGGNVIGLVGTSVDITERKAMEDALRQADRRKDEFLAMLAHELRNPLAPINTAAQVLRLSAGDPQRVQDTSEVITRQVRHLTRLVDDLLDVSRVTRGLVELQRRPVDLRSVVTTAVEQVRPLVQSRRHELRTRVGPGPFTVSGDFHRLVQVVANLVNNSAKYTAPGGRIEVILDVQGPAAVLEVRDNGVGIEAGMLEQVFELFIQAERTPDRSQGGLGIGLALVRSLVQLHGGRVSAASPGLRQGSTFRVELPLSEAERTGPPPPIATRAAGGRRVLIVDDNVDAADTLAQMLQMLGHAVETAHDARTALARASGAAAWDAFILDIGLPDMTGYELARRLREAPGRRDTTFVALTGYGQAQDRAASRSSGFDHHLVKPADIAQLLEILEGKVPMAAAARSSH